MNEAKLREGIKELMEEIEIFGYRRDWKKVDQLELEIEELTQELQTLARSNYYSKEKVK